MDGRNDWVGYLKDDQLRVLVQSYNKLCGYVRISSLGRNIEEVVNKGSSILAIVQGQESRGQSQVATLTSTPHPRMETPNFGDISAIQSFREDEEVEDSMAENETEVSVQMNETRNPDDGMKGAQMRNNSLNKDNSENENGIITITEDLDLLDEYENSKPEEAIQLNPNKDKLMGKEEDITKKDTTTENVAIEDMKVDSKLHRGLKLGRPHPPSNVGKGKTGIKLTRKKHMNTMVTKKKEETAMRKSEKKFKLAAENSTDVRVTVKKPKKEIKRRRMSIFEVFPPNDTVNLKDDSRRPSRRRAAKKMKPSMDDSQDEMQNVFLNLTDQNGNTSGVKGKPKTPAAEKGKRESKKMTPGSYRKSGMGMKRKHRSVINFHNTQTNIIIIIMQVWRL